MRCWLQANTCKCVQDLTHLLKGLIRNAHFRHISLSFSGGPGCVHVSTVTPGQDGKKGKRAGDQDTGLHAPKVQPYRPILHLSPVHFCCKEKCLLIMMNMT